MTIETVFIEMMLETSDEILQEIIDLMPEYADGKRGPIVRYAGCGYFKNYACEIVEVDYDFLRKL